MRLAFIIAFLGLISCSNPNDPIRVVKSPALKHSGEPSFFKVRGSGVGLSWLERSGDTVRFKFATYKDQKWSNQETIVEGTNLLTNWADFPGIVTNGDHWLAWVLQFSNPETFAYDVMISQSSDAGQTWSKPQKLHADSTQSEHGFVSAVPTVGGFQLIWLDGRNSGGHGAGAMNLRAAFVGFDETISQRKLLDDRTCDCCQTALASVDESESVAFYRDRSEEEVRDIKAIRLVDEGDIFNPLTINNDNWEIEGCPVNGPRAVVKGDEIAVAWFTMGEDKVSKVQVAFSYENKRYSQPILIDTGNLGRVDILERKGSYYVSYIDEENNGASIKLAEINNREIVHTYMIEGVSTSRKTGFPRMINISDGILIAYTNADTEAIEVQKLKLD